MNLLLKPAAALLGAFIFTVPFHKPEYHLNPRPVFSPVHPAPTIQVAVLLDVSNSMDGLIDQARAQLWNMVTVLGKAKCNELSPRIEIALYEYGRDNNDPKKGYVKQINNFTGDLDQLSRNLFSLTTNGGQEYCGHVMYSSLTEMPWDTSAQSYKVIFIAGNEDFLQGDISYTKACEEARKKGVVINTIYCGDKQQGIKEHWNIMGECGGGSFTNINPDARIEDVHTPYDSSLLVLNDRLNTTYLWYGQAGNSAGANQVAADKLNSYNMTVATKRISVKANGSLYNQPSADIVDATAMDSSFVTRVDRTMLPDSLKNKSRAEIRKIVKQKADRRAVIQKQIGQVNIQRENYIAEAKKRAALKNNTPTLESEIEKIIRKQAARYNMIID